MPKKTSKATKKKEEEYDDDLIDDIPEDELEEETEYFNEEKFKCRVCGKETTVDNGDDLVLICDNCQEKYNMDKLWNDFDAGRISEDQLKTVDLTKYKNKR